MDEWQNHYAQFKKPGTRDHMLCDSICMKYLEKAKI